MNRIAVRVESIEGLENVSKRTTLAGLIVNGLVWEIVPKNMAEMEMKFVDKNGNETKVYAVRSFTRMGAR